MDPLSIVSASAGVITAVAKTSILLFQFSCTFRDTGDDLTRMANELNALAAIVDPLSRALAHSKGTTLTQPLLNQIDSTLAGCSLAVEQVAESLQKYQRDTAWTKAKWAMYGQDDVKKLCESVKVYNLALTVSLQAVSLSLGQDIKDNTEQIKVDLDEVRLDTKEILARVESIRRMGGRPPGANAQVQQWIEDISMLSSYAGSTYKGTIVDPEDSMTQAHLTSAKDSSRLTSPSGLRKPPPTKGTKMLPLLETQPNTTSKGSHFTSSSTSGSETEVKGKNAFGTSLDKSSRPKVQSRGDIGPVKSARGAEEAEKHVSPGVRSKKERELTVYDLDEHGRKIPRTRSPAEVAIVGNTAAALKKAVQNKSQAPANEAVEDKRNPTRVFRDELFKKRSFVGHEPPNTHTHNADRLNFDASNLVIQSDNGHTASRLPQPTMHFKNINSETNSISFTGLEDIADEITRVASLVKIDKKVMAQSQHIGSLLAAAEMDRLARQLRHESANHTLTPKSIQSLVGRGASLTYIYSGVDMSSLTLGSAIHHGDNECLFALLRYGADPSIRMDSAIPSIDAVKFQPSPKTPLEYAIRKNNEKAVWALVAAGALRQELSHCFPSWIFAAFASTLTGNLKKRVRMLKFLVANGLGVVQKLTTRGQASKLTLLLVALLEWEAMDSQTVTAYVKALLEAGVYLDLTANYGTPWQLAAKTDNAKLLKVVAPYIKADNSHSWDSSICRAASYGNFSALEVLAKPPYRRRDSVHNLVRLYMADEGAEAISGSNFLRAIAIFIGGHGRETLNRKEMVYYESRKWSGKSWITECVSVYELVGRARTNVSRSKLKEDLVRIAERGHAWG